MKRLNLNSQSAFILPSILVVMTIIAIVAFSTMQLVRTSALAASKQSYLQMAHVASKAAMDYAKEQYELDSNYSGTPEQDFLVNDDYRITIQVDVLSTSGNTKFIQAFGYVYLPEVATSAIYVRDIKGGIIREGITSGTPADYDPLLWLDASVSSSLVASSASSGDQTITSQYGSGSGSVVEERGSDASGTPGTLVWGNDDLDMSWGGNNKGNQIIGIRFTGVDIPQGATVDQAYIQFTTDETRKAGSIDFDIEGVDSDNAPTWSGNFAVSGATTTAASVNWSPVDWNVVGANGINERTSDLSSIIQEIVDRPGWSDGNAMAFSITKSGGGVGNARRTAEKGQNGGDPQLYVSWTVSGSDTEAGNGDSVTRWEDQSGNGNDATFVYGTPPVRRNSQLNGQPIVEFNADGLHRSSFSSVTGENLTAFIVMRPGLSSQDNARFLTAMKSSESSDDTANSIIPLRKISTTSNLESYYNGTQGEVLNGAIDNAYALYVSRMTANPNWSERLIKNGIDNYSSTISSINYNFNQIFIGGGRVGSSGSYYADADIAEIIVYDKELPICDIESLESYFAAKWGIIVSSGKC